MILEITQNDIDQGVRGDSYSCPIAISLRRKFPNLYPIVGLNGLSILDPKKLVKVCCANFNSQCKNFIMRFDRSTIKVEPTHLEIDLQIAECNDHD